MCALVCALEYRPAQIIAVDSVSERLERAKKLGAIPLNFKTQDVKAEVLKATDDAGADAVIEAVGHEDALRTAFEVVRAGGKISVIGKLAVKSISIARPTFHDLRRTQRQHPVYGRGGVQPHHFYPIRQMSGSRRLP